MNRLIIFTRNLLYGKVKTRLAATKGNDYAFRIYEKLIEYTRQATDALPCDRIVYYSEYVEKEDTWNGYFKAIQQGDSLGERMAHAFKDSFDNGTTRAVIIGTDCFEINHDIIMKAFGELDNNDIVIGPARDGGYYLLGMKRLHRSLFENMAWSTPAVLDATTRACDALNLSYFLLPVLHDVDEAEDLHHPTVPGWIIH